jgi:hypothetical protein
MNQWPELNFANWKDTYETLHRWLQLVGKVRTYYAPWMNHSWSSTLYVSSRGLTTSAIPLSTRNLTIEVDLIDHELIVSDSLGHTKKIPLINESVASFHRRFTKLLRVFDLETDYLSTPNELTDATPFQKDFRHSTYDPGQARRCFDVLVLVSNIMLELQGQFTGKSSPVHFFWGSFDLALTRFSGRPAPEHPGGIPNLSDVVTREAYSHEVISLGFWPGNETYPQAVFYAYGYPEPEGLKDVHLEVREASYHPVLSEFVLDYDAVRSSSNPSVLVKKFFHSSFEAISKLADWDAEVLEVSPNFKKLRESNESHRRSD